MAIDVSSKRKKVGSRFLPFDSWKASSRETVLYAVFFASGASGLLFEMLWFYQSGLALGNSTWAASIVLTAFMAGLALGNLVAILRGSSSVNPIRTYAVLEVIIALTGPLLVFFLPVIGKCLTPIWGPLMDRPALVNPLRFLLAFLTLMIPSTAMGMTLPVLTRALAEGSLRYGEILGKLYGFNTIGAVAGVLAGELLLIPRVGIWGTTFLAASLNLAAGTAAWRMSSSVVSTGTDSAIFSWRDGLRSPLLPYLSSIAIAGFLLLALEVVWIRFLSLFITSTSLAFAVILAVVLSGIASGGLAASVFLKRRPDAPRAAGSILFISGALCALSYTLFPHYYHSLKMTPIGTVGQMLWICLPLMFPISFLSGSFFTLAGSTIRSFFSSSQVAAGWLTFFNTVGAAWGSVIAGLFLIPQLGLERSFYLLSLLYGLVGIWWWMKSKESRKRLFVDIIPWMVSLALFPFGTMENKHLPLVAGHWVDSPQVRIAGIREGLTETLMVLEFKKYDQPMFYRMITNSFSMSSSSFASRRYMKQFAYWPLLVHPNPKTALLICFGVGSTAKALTDSKNLKSIDIVDISKDILDMSRIVFPHPSENPLRDSRVRVYVEDGRFFLQASPEKFDIITGEPPPPELAGVASLYTREYFHLIFDRLNAGGVVTYWLPIYQLSEPATLSILRAFSDVFKTSFLWHGSGADLMMVGVKEPNSKPTEAGFNPLWRDPGVAAELKTLGFEGPEQFGAGFIGDGPYLRRLTRNTPPLVDDFPKRILAKGADHKGLYTMWFDGAAAKERFRNSPDVMRFWSPRFMATTLPYFDTIEVVTTMGKSVKDKKGIDFASIHHLLTRTLLQAPVLWILGSSGDDQKRIENVDPVNRNTPLIQYHLGVKLLAERNYPGASGLLKNTLRLELTKENRALVSSVYLYTLCLADRVKEAQAYLEEISERAEPRLIPGNYWIWMQKTFGLSIPDRILNPQRY